MKSFWVIFLFLALVACSPSSAVITPGSTANINPINTATVSFDESTTTSVPTGTTLPTQGVAIPTPIAPEIKTVVPNVREMKLSELEISNTTRLLLYHRPSESLQIMSGQDTQPRKIPNIDSEAWIFGGIDISPDQKWFIYEVSKGMKGGNAYVDYWISSIDGKEQKIAVSNVKGNTEVRWATNEQIELWNYPDGQRVCPQRTAIINPFTEETLLPSQLPLSIKPQCFFDLSTNPDRSKIIYLDHNGLWSIYDSSTAESQTIFPWLSKSERFALWPEYIQWSTNGITLVIPGQESVDFIVDLPISDVSKSNVDLNHVLLPNGKEIYNRVFSWWALDKGLLGFDLIDTEYNYAEGEKTSQPSNFVILDLKNSVLYDYNLDRAKTGETQKLISSFVYPSADNRFLAWTIYEPPSMGDAIETVVLDRETGQIARVKGFEFYGWGEISQP